MLISKAYAQSADITAEHAEALANAPDTGTSLLTGLGLPVILMVLFYVLLIMPQQKRFKEHSKMLQELKKGDKVVTGGGLIGKVDKIIDDTEVVIDLGGGQKVTALRSTIQSKADPLAGKPANDPKKK